MSAYDLPLAGLEGYRPEREEPADFDAFWHDTLTSSRAAGGPPLFERIDGPLRIVTVDDVTFSGFAGHPIKGWLIAPVSATLPLPTIIEFIGYGGGRAAPFDWLQWASAGYAHFVMDTRGQGSAWSAGDTADPDATATAGHNQRPRTTNAARAIPVGAQSGVTLSSTSERLRPKSPIT